MGATFVTMAGLLACSADVLISTPVESSQGGGPTSTHGVGGRDSGGGGSLITSAGGGVSSCRCDADQYCDDSGDECNAHADGVCVPRPEGCYTDVEPVCACDGNVYANACEANLAGFDVSVHGGCSLAPGQQACGPLVCEASSQYCLETSIKLLGTEYDCPPLPSACTAPPDCNCIALDPPPGTQCTCSSHPDGGLLVTCAQGIP